MDVGVFLTEVAVAKADTLAAVARKEAEKEEKLAKAREFEAKLLDAEYHRVHFDDQPVRFRLWRSCWPPKPGRMRLLSFSGVGGVL